ncbi:hypothetical protein SAMN05216241_1053 [Limimonas halophila]|uniref:Modulator of FtsH protease n=1 Tax=Limimonas halophila TaxID=1082479 RepID=A0A1G7R7Y2_9PROT|nr:Bax inhibitor-1/YccA family protein [Limimonas halophila]SDG06289.1 hypothetical protein SAMN05216241_1053 [Limimonas halophila]
MAESPDRRTMTRAQAEAAQVDVGLRNYMLRVYNYMALGVAFTGAVSLLTLSSPAIFQTVASLMLLWFIGILGLSFFGPRIIASKSVGAAQICFWTYAGLWGLFLAPVLMQYLSMDPWLVPRAFFITTGAFAGLSLFGYTTKKDLGPVGTFCAMALMGMIVVMIVSFFFTTGSLFSLLFSGAVVLIMAGMTAYQTQEVKNRYDAGDSGDVAASKSIFGAFELYTTFMVMFINVLQILGIMQE